MMGPLTKKGAKPESRGYEVDIWWYLLESHVPPKKRTCQKKNAKSCKHEKIVDIKWTAQVFARTNRAKHTVLQNNNITKSYNIILTITSLPTYHQGARKQTTQGDGNKQKTMIDNYSIAIQLLASKMDTVESSKKLPVRSFKVKDVGKM